jgi:hypothetical protein
MINIVEMSPTEKGEKTGSIARFVIHINPH